MTTLPLLAVILVMKVIAVLFIICAVVLVLIILIQKGKGGGLTGVLGGGMASGILGSKTGDFLTWFTIGLVGVFLMLSIVMAKFYKPSIHDYGAGEGQRTTVPTQSVGYEERPVIPAAADESGDINSPGD